MDVSVVSVSNVRDLWPFAFVFRSTAAALPIYSSTADKLLSDNRFDLHQMLATSLQRFYGYLGGYKETEVLKWNSKFLLKCQIVDLT